MYKFTHAIILSRKEYDTIMKVDGYLDWDNIDFDFITHALISEHNGYITFVHIGQSTESPIVDYIEGFMDGAKYMTAECEEHKAVYVYDKENYVDPDSFPMRGDILDQYQKGKAVWQD